MPVLCFHFLCHAITFWSSAGLYAAILHPNHRITPILEHTKDSAKQQWNFSAPFSIVFFQFIAVTLLSVISKMWNYNESIWRIFVFLYENTKFRSPIKSEWCASLTLWQTWISCKLCKIEHHQMAILRLNTFRYNKIGDIKKRWKDQTVSRT